MRQKERLAAMLGKLGLRKGTVIAGACEDRSSKAETISELRAARAASRNLVKTVEDVKAERRERVKDPGLGEVIDDFLARQRGGRRDRTN